MNIIRKYKISKITNMPLTGRDGEIISYIEDIFSDLIPIKWDSYITYINGRDEWVFEEDNTMMFFKVNMKYWDVLSNTCHISYVDIQILILYFMKIKMKHTIKYSIVKCEDISYIK